ncbi:unannotated protein [freshwater metagenome]|uniref:Unannotated protein n=1 Tax=freshwater metagenome TaxID=449393 RepID=A0A6J7I7L7_9ZZZZ
MVNGVRGVASKLRRSTIPSWNLLKGRYAYETLFDKAGETGEPSSATPSCELSDQIREALIDLAARAESVESEDGCLL